jgi:hypothetical protein
MSTGNESLTTTRPGALLCFHVPAQLMNFEDHDSAGRGQKRPELKGDKKA